MSSISPGRMPSTSSVPEKANVTESQRKQPETAFAQSDGEYTHTVAAPSAAGLPLSLYWIVRGSGDGHGGGDAEA